MKVVKTSTTLRFADYQKKGKKKKKGTTLRLKRLKLVPVEGWGKQCSTRFSEPLILQS